MTAEMPKIKVGIVGYGNLGKGVELALRHHPDMELVAIFSRRPANKIKTEPQAAGETTGLSTGGTEVPIIPLAEIEAYQEQIDVAILCGGSATDLPAQGPQLATLFHTVDSFDNHGEINTYFQTMDQASQSANKVSIISTGWDPGLFSLNRLLFEAILPQGTGYTFWGKGLSQGHSDAIRRVPGVKLGVQYTIPAERAIESIRSGENPSLSKREMHQRECYVVAEAGADQEEIAQTIQAMPNYFADYETTVHFITEEEMKQNHQSMPHGGLVMRSATTGEAPHLHQQLVEFSLNLQSNPEFTASVLVSYARAAYRLATEQRFGAKTVLDIPLAYLSPKSGQQLRKEII